MNKYDERYIFRLAKISDIENIMCFLDQHWQKNHILSKDRALFEYEFFENDSVNVMLAIDRNTETIEAMTGFLRCSHTKEKEKQYVWGSFWKVNDSKSNMTFLGVELMKRLIGILQCKAHLGIGINPKTSLPIRKMIFHDTVAKMNHYYFLNDEIEDYKIAKINKRYKSEYNKGKNTKIVVFDNIQDVKEKFDINKTVSIPYKDYWYINKRYFGHPYYKYNVYGLVGGDASVNALLITREVSCMQRKVLRIVDYIGDVELLSGCGYFFEKLLLENEYEYIDFYNWGYDSKHILGAGFKLKDEADENIIPNYFEPFLQENVDIWVRYKEEDTVFCKADGDQDRPNEINNFNYILPTDNIE